MVPFVGRTPQADEIRRLCAGLEAEGITTLLTSALTASEQAPFLAAGFEVHQRLHLLRRDVDGVIRDGPLARLRRGRRSDRPALLRVDAAAFSEFWRLDEDGLAEALTATPSSRLRVSLGGDDEVAAYAVTGRAGSRGYLQRLAVDPDAHRAGHGTALVLDALRWVHRWGGRDVLVNTQVDNEGALALYERLGFERRGEGLAVLRRQGP